MGGGVILAAEDSERKQRQAGRQAREAPEQRPRSGERAAGDRGDQGSLKPYRKRAKT